MKAYCNCLFIMFLSVLFFGCASETAHEDDTLFEKQNFDFNWKFSLGDYPEASNLNYDDTGWRTLDLPHDWSIEGQVKADNPTGNDGGYYPAGIGWYRKSFNVDKTLEGKQLSIYFEGVYMNAEVFINGESLGVHPYGYTSFAFDLTPYVKYGASNQIAVRVDNSQQKNCRWYSGSGIYRHVWLMVDAPVHIKHWGIGISTSKVTQASALVEIHTTLKNDSEETQNFELLTVITDKNGETVAEETASVSLEAHAEKVIPKNIQVHHPDLWSPESPDLYKAVFILKQGETILDKETHEFGIRTIGYSAETGFQLNGKPIKLNGGCVHHDNGILGAAAYDRAEERKVELLKSAGYNAVRTAHNPPSEAFLEACDRLGLLVIDESFDGWKEQKTPFDYASIFDSWWQRDIEAMVLRDRNHPSIIMWSSGNEIIERTKPEAVETAGILNSYIRTLDPTRPVTSAMTSWSQGWDIFDPLMAEHDICGYNYMMHESEGDHDRVPSRVIVQTESYPKDAFYNWKMVQDHDYIIGDFVWTAMDYLGESSIGRYYYQGEPEGQHWEKDFYPWHGAYCGDIDLIGWRKPISHYRDLLWNSTEKIYMAVREPNPSEGEIKTTMWAVWPTWESWNWPGHEGKPIAVEVYSKYPKVRLYLNDELIGEKATGIAEEYKAVFTLPYSEGVLKAVGVNDEQEQESCVLKTEQQASEIKLIADKTTMKANGQDLVFVTVEVTDNDGQLVTIADNSLSFTVSGSGSIIAAGNANLKDETPYVALSQKVWKGRALVVLKSSQATGEIRLKAAAEGLKNAELIVNVVD
ncbi:sugar-binding domain-containing protein [Formosa sp. S-31]|uniref:sugar-binding domain-containing protein n=1 Tax=Formosa sp. S-31 TaxID=2790949 RepID=UPI003EC09183